MQPTLQRHELEDYIESALLELAESLVDTSQEELKSAKDFFPVFFGGEFPALGLAVTRSQGHSTYMDKRKRPGQLIVEVRIYHPCLPGPYRDPERNPIRRDEDRTGYAKRLTRHIRGLFLEKLFATQLGQHVQVIESRGASMDQAGNAVTEESGRSILWIDTTILQADA